MSAASQKTDATNLPQNMTHRAGMYGFRRKVSIGGRQHILSFRLSAQKKEAQKLLAALTTAFDRGTITPLQALDRYKAGETVGAILDRAGDGYTVRRCADAWLKYARGKGNTGWKADASKLDIWCKLLGSDTPIHMLESDHILDAQSEILEGFEARKGTRSLRTVGTFTTVLKSALALAEDGGHPSHIGSRIMKTVQSKPRKVAIDWGFFRAVQDLVSEGDPKLSFYIWLVHDTGARNVEINALRWDDLKLERGALLVDYSRLPETNKIMHRGLKLTRPETIAAYKAWRERDTQGTQVFDYSRNAGTEQKALLPFIACVAKGRRVAKGDVSGKFRGVQDLRHELIQSLHLTGVTIKDGMAILGHRRVETHAGYGGPKLSMKGRPSPMVEFVWSSQWHR